MAQEAPEVPIEIRTQDANVQGANRTFGREFSIGRGSNCEVQVESRIVSRVHARVTFEEGRWWIVDADSTNGVYLDEEAVDRAPLPSESRLRLGEDGPSFTLRIPGSNRGTAGSKAGGGSTHVEDSPAEEPSSTEVGHRSTSSSASVGVGGSGPAGESVTQYVRYYFEGEGEGSEEGSGEHTRMLRKAYDRVRTKRRRKYLVAVGGIFVLCLCLGAYAVVQHMRNDDLERAAEEMFVAMKELDVQITQLKRRIEESGDASLEKQLASLEEQRRRQHARYAGYVEELGLHRSLSPKEREIYRMARIFGESEFSIPAGFVREVRHTIEDYWKGQARADLVQAIERAEANGYSEFIVETMQDHALPPEFFYLALQESRLRVDAVGPRTRWGIAKGMWQFIPSTAREYGLRVGPRAETRVFDPRDERHDFKKSTRAAAEYLQTIYSTKARASGLLVIASYNWGEHRVLDKLDQLPGPQGIPDEALEGIPENPSERNYWQFLTRYSERMPEETKEYVLKVFSAAVIGQNPEVFGFDFENPLREHMEAPPDTDPVS